MADWSLIETTLETWVENITGLPTYWRSRPSAPTYSDSGYVLLSISAIVTQGFDEVYTEYDDGAAAGSEVRSWQRGHRTFTLAAQVRAHRQAVDNDAKHYTSLLRDSIRMPVKTVDLLYEADIAVAKILAETVIDEDVTGREMSVAQLDIRINAKSVTEDTSVGYIATITGAVAEDENGNDYWSGNIAIG